VFLNIIHHCSTHATPLFWLLSLRLDLRYHQETDNGLDLLIDSSTLVETRRKMMEVMSGAPSNVVGLVINRNNASVPRFTWY
jgi:hypothetical protein